MSVQLEAPGTVADVSAPLVRSVLRHLVADDVSPRCPKGVTQPRDHSAPGERLSMVGA